MTNLKVIAIALALVVGVGCKKKKTEGGTTTGTAMGTGAGTDMGTGAGTGMGTGEGTGAGTGAAVEEPKKEIVVMTAADMEWKPMMADQKDSPMIVPLWGDMTKEANGWLIKLKGGTKGTHHTHSTAYHGVVIAGQPSHFMDGQKKGTPLPVGSYWMIPGGVPHTSQCLGKDECIALVHFNEGAADMAPAEAKKGGKPSPEYVEKLPKALKWAPLMPDDKEKSPQIADVWGDSASEPHGRMWKFPAGFTSPPHTHGSDYHGVVLKGTILNYLPDDKNAKEMGPGSYWMQPGGGPHITACKEGSECLIYTYTLGKFDFAMADAGGTGGGGGADTGGGGGAGTGGGGGAGTGAGGAGAGTGADDTK